ncbi:NAD(P)-dependent oxidoreductase [Cognatiyoonia sp. IB215446]|uniref:NAD-dependent epimerase/dehydratase family protein n=1 Tax=Cognatiyoonia sp. IB215446 TaxID=3097355 RepID=UPI002A0AE98B|nr:NAD(P)-dependent oxidoreductase [Cognatiyoonia sp. IB215446]MDX8349284.1 NAD(P)-dependent oxidoreductase [Cognatiyoonia sp. IB215446]
MVDDLKRNMPLDDLSPILITGANGYLGRSLMTTFRGRGLPVLGVARKPSGPHCDFVADLRHSDALEDALASLSLSRIVHAAAVVPKTNADYANAAAAEENAIMAQNVANYAQSKNVPLILVSSMTVYSAAATNPVVEDNMIGKPGSAYAVAKRRAEAICRYTGVTGFAARIPGLFGGDRADGLVANVKRALKSGDNLVLPGEPVQWAAMHVQDAADAIAELCQIRAMTFQAVNVGYEGPMSISRLYSIACELFGRETDHTVDHPDFEFDLHRWKSLTGQSPKRFHDVLEGYLT